MTGSLNVKETVNRFPRKRTDFIAQFFLFITDTVKFFISYESQMCSIDNKLIN